MWSLHDWMLSVPSVHETSKGVLYVFNFYTRIPAGGSKESISFLLQGDRWCTDNGEGGNGDVVDRIVLSGVYLYTSQNNLFVVNNFVWHIKAYRNISPTLYTSLEEGFTSFTGPHTIMKA